MPDTLQSSLKNMLKISLFNTWHATQATSLETDVKKEEGSLISYLLLDKSYR